MTLDNTSRGFSILGVYHTKRRAKSETLKNRTHTAVAFRLSGRSCFTCGERTLLAEKDSMIYIPAGVDYAVDRKEEELIVVHLACFRETSREIELLSGCPELREPFLRLHAEWESCDPAVRHNRCMSLLYAIFENAQKVIQRKSDAVPEVIRAGVALLRAGFKSPDLSVSDLADACRISEVYFRRLYKAHFGVSPLASLLDLRFEYAKSLLRSGYYATKAVAAMSGFTDVKYFRTAFTRRVGVTPSEFRRRSTGEADRERNSPAPQVRPSSKSVIFCQNRTEIYSNTY